MIASSKVMASTSTANPDLQHQPGSICSPLSTIIADLQSDPSRNFGSMSMDDLLKSYYSDGNQVQIENLNQNPSLQILPSFEGVVLTRDGSFSLPKEVGNRSVDEVWKEIVAGGSGDQTGGGGEEACGGDEEMTLEDFLTKAGAVREEDVRRDPVVAGRDGYGVEAAATVAGTNGQFQMQAQGVEGTMVGYGNGVEGRVVTTGATGGRGKRKAVQEPQVDKATQQRQRRMIKNRESAARSRERKQAYTVELEALVTQLEEENARLLREEAEHNKQRLKQLMENFIPVVKKQTTARVLRRVNSMQW